VDDAYRRYEAARQARAGYARPDRDVERRLWQAAADLLRAHGEGGDAAGPLPADVAAEIADVLERLVRGEWPQELKALHRRGGALPGGQKARYVDDAVRYVCACRENIIAGVTVEQAVAEVADEYEVSPATVGDWLGAHHDIAAGGEDLVEIGADAVPDDLREADPATRLDALMRRSGYYFRIWPRLP